MERVLITDFTLIPIPQIEPVTGWKQIEIKECGEPLLRLNNIAPNLIVIDPQYYKQGIEYASQDLYAREGIAQRLIKTASLLPNNYRFLIWDAWRPLEVQQALFDSLLETLKRQNPDTPEKALKEIAQTYVSLPSGNPNKPSPHFTGGAIDLSILGPDGESINMGTSFDYFGPQASARYYEDRSLESEEEGIRNNRRLFYQVMVNSGFSGYDEEWWHYDYGNQFHAAKTDKDFAKYGPISIPTLEGGE